MEQQLKQDISDRNDLLLKEKSDIELELMKTEKESKNYLFKIINFNKMRLLVNRKGVLSNNFEVELNKPFVSRVNIIKSIKEELMDKEENHDKWVEKLSDSEYKDLINTKRVLEENNEVFIGAKGEYHALKELKKLPDSYTIINDFHKKFDTPIPDRKNDDKIFSVQIDHIVLGPTGIFLIETKNWSEASIENKDLFSPVRQLQRASHAMFVLLNRPLGSYGLESFNQNWGTIKISPKNIILMMRNKPNHIFQFVEILTLEEVNKFITNGKTIFSTEQIDEITEYLLDIGNVNTDN